jgi:hypothetical protein
VTKKDVSRRLRDYTSRKNAGADVSNLDATEYLAVHLFADDEEVSDPEPQSGVDAYWHVLDDVVFVQVMSESVMNWLPQGRYKRWSPGEISLANLVVVVPERAITREVFERELRGLLDAGVVREAIDEGDKLPQTLTSA